jgi:hypothetical protein
MYVVFNIAARCVPAILKFTIAGIMRKGVADNKLLESCRTGLPRHNNQPHLTTCKQEKY